MPLLRFFTMPVALLSGLTGAFVSAGPASAESGIANLVVAVSADRSILSTDGWSSVDVNVSNDGPAAASGVTVTFTLPAGLRPIEQQSTSDWSCDWGNPVMTCTSVGDLAAGASGRVIEETAVVDGAHVGDALEVGATATTTTHESSTDDNAASKVIHIVDTAVVKGHLWNDLNADGIRQANEPAATSVGITVSSQDDEDSYGFSNNFDGTYSETVPVKRFKVTTSLSRYSWRFTTPNVGSDDTDSDLVPVSQDTYSQTGESPVFTVSAATPTVVDVGVVAAFRPTKISPASGQQGTTAVLTLTGASFSSSLTAQLTRSGSTPIAGTVMSVSTDGTSMTVSFPLAQAATGAWTLTLDRQYGPHAEVSDAFTVAAPSLRSTAAPAITGTVAVGSTVKASPGTWTPAATSYTYQWYANGAAVPSATHNSLAIPASLLGKKLTVKVTALRSGYTSATATSRSSAAVAKGKALKATKKPSISGTLKAGDTVRAVAGTWSPKADSYQYQWRLNGKLISGATHSSLKLTSSMRNKTLTVTVTARKAGYANGTATSTSLKIHA